MNGGGCLFVLRPARRTLRHRPLPCRRAPGISADELAMCRRMGVFPAAYHRAALHDLITHALAVGLLTPSQRAWAERQTLETLREYLGASR